MREGSTTDPPAVTERRGTVPRPSQRAASTRAEMPGTAGDASCGEVDARSREVGILGGSFNPPHVAHIMAAYWVLATEGVGEVWLTPSFKHPFGKQLAPFEHRVEMCRLAVAPVRGAHVCTVERELAEDPLVGRTVRVLELLRSKHPTLRFALVVGSDVLGETDKWYRWDRVQELARIIVVGRCGHATASDRALTLPEVSSTSIRESLRRGEDVSAFVPKRVLDFIVDQGLYR